MRFDLRAEIDFLYFLMLRLGMRAYDRFHERPLVVHTKADGTRVTDLDMLVHEAIVDACRADKPEWAVRSEESDKIPNAYKVFIVDPIDGTDDSIAGQYRTPRSSLAMISIGVCVGGMLLGGVVGAPFLNEPLAILKGGGGLGVWREHDACRIDPKVQRGLVLVSTKTDDKNLHLQEELRRQGLTPYPVDGTVFRASSFMDPSLLRRWSANVPKQPIIGMVNSGQLHDYAAVVPMAKSLEAIVTTRQGDLIDWDVDPKAGCVMANNPATHDKILAAINS